MQRTVLSQDDINKIVNTAVERKDIEDFSITVSLKDIKDKNYSFSAGQYFPVKIEYVELTQEEFDEKMDKYQKEINKLFDKSEQLGRSLHKSLENINYETKKN